MLEANAKPSRDILSALPRCTKVGAAHIRSNGVKILILSLDQCAASLYASQLQAFHPKILMLPPFSTSIELSIFRGWGSCWTQFREVWARNLTPQLCLVPEGPKLLLATQDSHSDTRCSKASERLTGFIFSITVSAFPVASCECSQRPS